MEASCCAIGRSCDEAIKAWCSLWLFALALADSGRRFPWVDLLCVVVLWVVLWVVLLAAWDAGVEVFLCVVEEDELLWDQQTADNAPARARAATLPLQEDTFTANLYAPNFNCKPKTGPSAAPLM